MTLTPLERWSSDRSRGWFALPDTTGQPMRAYDKEICVGGTLEQARAFLAWAERNGVDLARLYAGPNGGQRVEILRDDWAWGRELGDAMAHFGWVYEAEVPAPGELPKRCSCGRVHDAEAWARLPYRGVHDDGTERIELRHCACLSTIGVVLVKTGVPSLGWKEAV